MRALKSTIPINEKASIFDYIVWISVFFYADPGGYMLEFGYSRVAPTFLLIVCYLSLFAVTSNPIGVCFKDAQFKKISKIVLCWFIFYYILIFLFLNSSYSNLTFVNHLIKTRLVITTILLPIPIYYFMAYRSSRLFIEVFIKLSIVISILFLLNVFTGVELIYTNKSLRGFVQADRIFLGAFGILEFGLYLLLVLLMIPKSLLAGYKKKMYLIACLGIYLIYIISLTRRYFVYVILAAAIGYFMANYLYRNRIIINYKSKFIAILFVLFFALYVFAPSYVEGVFVGLSTITFNPESSYGSTAARLSLTAHSQTLNLLLDNIFLGTGYINEWYSTAEEAYRGFDLEGADYVFLSSMAMYGIIGLLLFVPFYFYLYKLIFITMKHIRNHLKVILTYPQTFAPPVIVFFTISLFLLRHLFTYPDWFSFIGPQSSYQQYYIAIGLLFGSAARIRLLITNYAK